MALLKVGALWRKENDKGEYFSGELEMEGRRGPKLRILVFPNEDKKGNPKAPDYKVMLSNDDPQPRNPTPAAVPAREPGEDRPPF